MVPKFLSNEQKWTRTVYLVVEGKRYEMEIGFLLDVYFLGVFCKTLQAPKLYTTGNSLFREACRT